jgi:pSer/pThr/pTyr-binding forkhead associated (FHA) protein
VIRCSSCGKRHPQNTLFCDECGAYLQAEEHQRTAPLVVDDVDWTEADLGVTGALDEHIPQPLVVRLSIADSGREIEFPVSKEITVGRLDAASATFPDVDLTPDKGLEKGVSRRHARITRKANELYLEDLGSVNGTYLNGKRLTPYLPHALKNEDEIRLSRILMHIHFS